MGLSRIVYTFLAKQYIHSWLSNSLFFSKEISDVQALKPDKRKRIVSQCLTNQEAIDIMEEQEQSKRKKLSDKEFDKKMRRK